METKTIGQNTNKEKLTAARMSLLKKVPFYGSLLMHLRFGMSKCGTAFTDMSRIVWDPVFLEKLSANEVQFVMLHEVMHCVLNHIVRGRGKNSLVYNIAADIVVNSTILEFWGLDEFAVSGNTAMHLAPNGEEGRKFTTDQVYEMLIDQFGDKTDDIRALAGALSREFGEGIDDHSAWPSVPVSAAMQDIWKNCIRDAAEGFYAGIGAGNEIRKIVESIYKPSLNWRQALQDFVQLSAESYDYAFTPADRRFTEGDVILPSFYECEEESVEDIWTLIDGSGSISPDMFTMAYRELENAMEQFRKFRAKVSFFDTEVSEPAAVESAEDLKRLIPRAGGGTSFHAIFRYLRDKMTDCLPRVIIIITDGYASYPEEDAALGIPVLWILIDQRKDAPWGRSIHIEEFREV